MVEELESPGEGAVRPMQRVDVAAVAELAAGEATAPHWPLHEYGRMLDVIAESPGRRGAWVLWLGEPKPNGNQLAGFAMASHVAGVCELEAVVVRASLRGRQLGASLVQAVAGWGSRLGATRLQLEVRPSNAAALRLYARLGFTVDGARRGYYRAPAEDAVLMSLPLSASPGSSASAL